MTPETFAAFALFVVASSITPGPNNTMLMASGVNFGFRRSFRHLAGVQFGFIALLLGVGLGLQGVLLQFPQMYDVLRYAGGSTCCGWPTSWPPRGLPPLVLGQPPSPWAFGQRLPFRR